MILVDSSVWIDYFNNQKSKETNFLNQCLGIVPVATGDIIISEVLRGFKSDKAFLKAKELLHSLIYFDMLGIKVAETSADLYRICRKKGVTINKPNDLFIATFCILNKIPLLHSDRDFNIISKYSKLEIISI